MKIRLTLVLSVLLVVILGSFRAKKSNTPERIERFWVLKTFQNSDKQIVVAGDSRVYRGVSTQAILESSGAAGKSYNFGYSSAGLSKQYLDFVVSKLEVTSADKILIIGITPHSLTDEAFKNSHFNKYKKLTKIEVLKKRYITAASKYVSPIKPSSFFKVEKNNYFQEYHNDGWVASAKQNSSHSEGLASYKKTFSKYQVNPFNVEAFLEQVKVIASKGVKVIAFRPPSSEVLRALEDEVSGFDETYVKQRLKATGVDWLDFDDADFESYDGSHLHYNSAIKLSKKIGAQVKSYF